jgi:integrase/recombinase XerD
MGKGARERIIQVPNQVVISALCEYDASRPNFGHKDDPFFLNGRREKLSEQSVRHIINRYVSLADIELHITPHMFRHTFATLLLEEDVDIRYIQRILGHSSILTTQIYTHVTSNQQTHILATKHPRNKIEVG